MEDIQNTQEEIQAMSQSITHFCKEPCEARCCRTGQLIVNQKESKLFYGKKEHAAGLWLIDLSKGCEHLKSDARCGIYVSRPQLCQDFPLFLRGKKLLVASWCMAVKEGMLKTNLESFEQKHPEIELILI